MILKVHIDTSYLSEEEAHSRVRGRFYLGNSPPNSHNHNDAVHTTSKILKYLVTSAAEDEYADLITNTKIVISICIALHKLGHP